MARKGTYPMDTEKVRLLAADKGMAINELIAKSTIGKATFYSDRWHFPATIKLIADVLEVPVSELIIKEK